VSAVVPLAPVRSTLDSPFARDVTDGLARPGQKSLPPTWLYDELGSALFEAITVLPEYGLTRADDALIRRYAPEIVAMSQPRAILELGSGSGSKTRHLLEAAAARNLIRYLPIDVSSAALRNCAAALKSIERVAIEPQQATYLDGIAKGLTGRTPGQRVLVLFLGSTIGNFTPDEATVFLRDVRRCLRPGDCILIGADLVKPRRTLLAAYDDPLGVTAAFNLNLLARINRELAGEFVMSRFAHEARWNERDSSIEMHLRSRTVQNVRIGALGLTVGFARGETIWTESSHKFRPEEVRSIGEQTGWRLVRQWVDNGWGFAETLFTCPR
jgi:dimethylhistidine N-methyltransferase